MNKAYSYLTNTYMNLPIFSSLRTYNDSGDITKRKSLKKQDENTIIITEDIKNKNFNEIATEEHVFKLDKNKKTIFWFIIKPFILFLIVAGIFINVLIDYYFVVGLTKPISIATFFVGALFVIYEVIMMMHIIQIIYFKKKEYNKTMLEYFKLLPYFGYAFVLISSIIFLFVIKTSSTYLQSSIIILTSISFFAYVIYLYLYLPLEKIKSKKIQFYRLDTNHKIILIEIQDEEHKEW